MMFLIGLVLLGLGFSLWLLFWIEEEPIVSIIGIILCVAGLSIMGKGIAAAPETTEVVVTFENGSWEGGEVTC